MKRLTLTCLLLLLTVAMAFAVTKSQIVVYINGQRYYIHTVESKETIYSIAKTYGVSEQTIIELNSAELKSGENIKIPFSAPNNESKKMSAREVRKTFTKHKVKHGETLYSISRMHEISIDTIIEDNPKIDPIAIPEGYELLIRKKMRGKSSVSDNQAEWEEYKSDMNLAGQADGYKYHIVKPGETIYSLSREFEVSEEELIKTNNLTSGLKAGAMIKVRVPESELPEEKIEEEEEIEESEQIEQISFRALRTVDRLKVALLLPLSNGEKVNRQFADFYKGFEMGLKKIAQEKSRDVELNLYNTQRDTATVENIIESQEFDGTNLIIGPIYEDLLSPVVEYAEKNRIPVVSPLATLKESESSVLFQLAPNAKSKYDKLKEMLDNTKHVTLVYTQQTDTIFENTILSLMGERPYDKHVYRYEHPTTVAEKIANNHESAGDLSKYINNDKDNTIVVMSSSETDVDRILSALSSAQINIVARGGKAPRYRVLGNADWNRYKNIDKTVMFKNNVVFVSSYHAKRDNLAVRHFDGEYIEKHGTMPSLYTYRGYDAAMIFGEAIYSDIDYNLEGRSFTPLQSAYKFETDPTTGVHTNSEWIRVNYNNNYTITIE